MAVWLKRVPWKRLWAAVMMAYQFGQKRLEKNLSASERRELRELMAQAKGRKRNLTPKQRKRVAALVKKGAIG